MKEIKFLCGYRIPTATWFTGLLALQESKKDQFLTGPGTLKYTGNLRKRTNSPKSIGFAGKD